jgi:hypothetical protein
MRGDSWVDQVAAKPPESRKGGVLVRSHEPAVADNVGDQDCSELARFPHGAPLGVTRIARKPPHSGVYSCLTCALASIAANSACASAISGISSVGAKPSSAGARTAWASARRLVD